MAACHDQGVPALAGGWLAVDPAGAGCLMGSEVGHEGGDVAVVGKVAAGALLQPGDRHGHLVLVVADGVVEGEGEVQGELGVRHARCADLGA